MPAMMRLGSSWERAIERTWEVQGRGGKLQVGDEGRFFNPSNSHHEPPPSRLRNRLLGSVPAYTASSTGETATDVILGWATPESRSQLLPPSALLNKPS